MEYEDYERMETIRSLRKRIKDLRERLDLNSAPREELQRTPEVVEQRPVVDEARERKNAELDAMKAKLMGKKK